ncbi:hypothetical protein D8S78_14170 [Natrialba swarupiae]|nr:hypothetical protein [Natrialba swarupiae]
MESAVLIARKQAHPRALIENKADAFAEADGRPIIDDVFVTLLEVDVSGLIGVGSATDCDRPNERQQPEPVGTDETPAAGRRLT